MTVSRKTNQPTSQLGERRYGLRQAAAVADRVTARAFGRRGFAMTELLTRWPLIAGLALARYTVPEELRFPQGKGDAGTLWIRAEGVVGLELQHLQPVLIERINAICGFRAVRDLRIVQGPVALPKIREQARRRQLDNNEIKALHAELAPVSDPQLNAALARLGAGILGRQKHR